MELKHETQSQSPACSSLRNRNLLILLFKNALFLMIQHLAPVKREPQRAYINKENRTSAIVHAPRTISLLCQVFRTPLV